MSEVKELTIVREFNATIDRVYNAWTDPEIIAKWWGPNGVTNKVNKLDSRPNGEINIVMLAGEDLGELKGSEWPMEGKFQVVEPPTKLVYSSSAIIDGKPILDCLNTVTFETVNNKTKMTLNIRVTRITPEAEGPLSGMEIGWNQSIDKLTKLISS